MTLELVPPAPGSDPETTSGTFQAAPNVQDQPRTTDAANGDVFVAQRGTDYRYVTEWESWLRWTGTHWTREGAELQLFAEIVEVTRLEYSKQAFVVAGAKKAHVDAAKRFGGPASPEAVKAGERLAYEQSILKWLHGSQNSSKVRSCIEQLRSPLQVSFKALDTNPWLLNCLNGTVDLKTADLQPHDRGHYMTRCLAIPFDLDAKAPTWSNFLSTCMADSTHLQLYLQRLVGFTLTGTTQDHVVVFCYGDGANGKSTFLRVLHELLGPYACSAPRALLFQTKNEPHPTDLATLYGKRLAVCSEVGEDSSLDEAKMKDITGGDPISCRRMHEDFWSYVPTHKLWLAGNHKPVVRGTDDGVWRRWRVVPWTVQFPIEKQDKELPAKLLAELPGILAWAVKGCLEWRQNGIADPPEVMAATGEYREHSDILGEFFKTHVVFEPEGRMSARALRKLYETWCEEVGHQAVGARRLAQRLRKAGVSDTTIRVDGKVANGWSGVRQLADYERSMGCESP